MPKKASKPSNPGQFHRDQIGKPVASRKTTEVWSDNPFPKSVPDGARPLHDWRRRPSTPSPYGPF
jgi:hypothetical protein